jgi:O-Antigen ligase
MLASRPVRAAAERVGGLWPAAGAVGLCFCAFFFGAGDSPAPLVWIGAIALVLAAALLAAPVALGRPGLLFLGGLAGLAVVCGASLIWSLSPDSSWAYTNRTLVYLAFALAGVMLGVRVTRAAAALAAAALLGLVVGWALLAKCVPSLYTDYGRLARLRAPFDYWNELALLCAAGVGVALWLTVVRRRLEGVVLLFGLVVTLLLTYSRFGVLLAGAVAVAWVMLDMRRVESMVVLALGGGTGVAVFGVALALPGITSDGEPRHVRAHDGLVFALVVLAGVAVAAAGAWALRNRAVRDATRAQIERGAAIGAVVVAVAGLAVAVVFAGHLWHEFTNPGNTQVINATGRFATAKSDRWVWWQEAWHAFTRHPIGGTGAGTFGLENQMLRHAPVVVDEPHNTPLQFLSETGVIGFALYLATAAGALWAAWRVRRDPAGLALGLAVAAFFAHGVVDKDWNYVATCGPLFLVAGLLVGRPAAARARRPLLALAGLVVAFGVVYSLTAPWLAQRAYARGTESGAKQARSYDPLSVNALLLLATYEEGADLKTALKYYGEAVNLEPQNATTWYELGAFYFRQRQWLRAYDALNNSYTYDRFGAAAQPCGLLDQARFKAHNYAPKAVLKACPGLRRASSP